jgi:Ricin-type beta-trefoil lectin domain-like
VRTARMGLTVIAAAGGLLIAGSPAIAAVPAAASTSSQAPQAAGASLSAATTLTGEIHLTNGSGYSWTTHGDNAQLTIQASGGTDFYLTATSDTGYYKIHVANSSHCVEGEGGGNTAVIATDCAQGSINQRWAAIPYNGGCRLRNKATLKYATVYNDTDGKPIWESDGTQSGTYLAWSSNLWVGCG